MKKLMTFMLTLLMCVGMIVGLSFVEVHAETTTGTWGTATYEIDENNNFVFTGSGSISSRYWPSNVDTSQIKSVRCDTDVTVVFPTDCYNFFNNFSNLESVDCHGFDTSAVTDMNGFFRNCSALKFVDFASIDTKKVRQWLGMFQNCSSLTSIDLSSLDTSGGLDMYGMFMNCSQLKDLDLSNFNTRYVSRYENMFSGCSSLESLDISSFDTRHENLTITDFFKGCSQLKKINLGDKMTKFVGVINMYDRVVFPTPSGSEYTGKWIREDKAYGPYTPEELCNNYTSAMAGWWIWELKPTEYMISFEAGEGATGAMAPVNAPAGEDFILPANQFVNFGYDFDHWIEGKDGNKSYIDTIPANTYQAGDKVTLTAVWKKRDTSVTMQDGTFTFDIKAGEKATFNDIPAGTTYQVYELTPDGWVLVQQENASGVIEALEESAAAFWNQYQPGVTTVQFSGLKTLDGHPAKEGAYSFELLENGTVIDTATTQDGGFIQFKVIEYDAAGDHTYIIREVNPNDDSIDYDNHEETVMVSVTDDGNGNLSSEVIYDEDGIKFENKTRPGVLRITKNADVTEANKDDTFTFEITFSNENGMPISDNIYWYVEN